MYEFIFIGLIVAIAMAARLTENPFRVRFIVTETGANTYTEIDITLPVAVVAGGKAQAIELMKVVSELEHPSIEPGQENDAIVQIVADSQAAAQNYGNNDLIWRRKWLEQHEDATGIEQRATSQNTTDYDDLTDGDGRGEIIFERTIHIGVVGTGNAEAMTAQGYMLVHLVQLEAEEVVVQAFIDD